MRKYHTRSAPSETQPFSAPYLFKCILCDLGAVLGENVDGFPAAQDRHAHAVEQHQVRPVVGVEHDQPTRDGACAERRGLRVTGEEEKDGKVGLH